MKTFRRYLLIAALGVLTQQPMSAQADDDYTPLVREGSEWHYAGFFLRIEGDTVVNDIAFKKLIKTYLWSGDTEIRALIREEDKKVYIADSNSEFDGMSLPTENYELFGEELKFDFNDMSSLWSSYSEQLVLDNFPFLSSPRVIMGSDSCLKKARKCYELQYLDIESGNYFTAYRVYEGIGATFAINGIWYGDFLAMIYPYWCTCGTTKLYFMRNPEGEYEYIAEGYTVSDVERIRQGEPVLDATCHGDMIDLNLPGRDTVGAVELYSMSGQCVARQVTHGGTAQLSAAGLARGVYVVVYTDPQHRLTRKIVLQ